MTVHFVTALVLTLASFSLISLVYWSVRLGITPTPTGLRVRKTLTEALPDRVEGEILELGCGWGSLLPMLTRRYPGQRITGYERSLLPYLVARGRTLLNPDIRIKQQDLFTADLGKVGLVLCYLYPDGMTKLSGHLQEHLPAGALVISHTFHLPGWIPIRQMTANDLYRSPVFLYRVIQSDTEESPESMLHASGTSPAVPVNS